jgi:hypothetical protein
LDIFEVYSIFFFFYFLFFGFFVTETHWVSLAELTILLPQPPGVPKLQACTTMPGIIPIFLISIIEI